jgi:ABC-type molybdate transport system substrate-binding protein
MKRLFWSVGLLVTLGVAIGCNAGKAKESQAKKWVGVLNETSEVLATVKDEASARTAAPKLQQLFQREKELQATVTASANLSKEEVQALQDLRPDVEAARARREAELKRVSAMPGVREILKDALVPR